jgi:predicted ferric reductase
MSPPRPDAATRRRDAAGRHRPGRAPRPGVTQLATALAGLGLGATIGMGIRSESARALSAPGGMAVFLGQEAALVGSYLILLMVLLMGRIPAVERAVGQDRLARWHRRIGGWPIGLIAAHAVLITIGYAEQARTGNLHELGLLVGSYPDVLMATAAFGLMVLAGVTSMRRARARIRYETWWTVHLYLYLALALSFSHQLANGQSFVGHPLARAAWAALWVATAGVVLAFRILLPLARSAFHRLRVVSVYEEAPGVVSVICRGHHLGRLAVSGGQFFRWRFLTPGLCWQAHPYSLSALPRPPYIRVTVKALGDQSSTLERLRPGTWVVIEGPYGAFTHHRRQTDKVLLIGAGVGVTPLRALLEELPAGVGADVVLRATRAEDAVLSAEMQALASARGGTVTLLLGERHQVSLDAATVRQIAPDVAQRDVYVCGPEGFTDQVVAVVTACGVPEGRVHREAFAF